MKNLKSKLNRAIGTVATILEIWAKPGKLFLPMKVVKKLGSIRKFPQSKRKHSV